jgi:hypothetical protein
MCQPQVVQGLAGKGVGGEGREEDGHLGHVGRDGELAVHRVLQPDFLLGLGMHAIIDSFSPQHRAYRPNPTGLELLFHVVQELGVGVSSTDRAAAAAALREYHRSFRAGL